MTETKTETETQWIRDVPSNPMMQRQWSRTAIPWCTTHDSPKDDTFTEFDVCQTHRINRRFAPKDYLCQILTGGPDHKWWVDL